MHFRIAQLITVFSILQCCAFAAEEPRMPNKPLNDIYGINLKVDLAHLFTLKTNQEVAAYVTASDDSGRAVENIPISRTSSRAWFDFSSAAPEMPYNGKDVSVAQFVCNICYRLKNDMIPNRERFEYLRVSDANDLVLHRITWEPSLEAWYFHFNFKSATK